MNKYLSNKLTFFSFWLIILVVLLHSTVNVPENAIPKNIFEKIQVFISFGLCQVAVPLFFIISGYLFFFKIDNLNSIFKNILKRRNTLIFPYLLWCLFWFSFMWIIQSISYFKTSFGTPLSAMSPADLMMQLFYYPLNYPFWFLRELIVIVLLTPLLFILLRNKNILILTLLFILPFFISSIIPVKSLSISFVGTSSLFYFSLGAYFGINKYLPQYRVNRLIVFILLFIWLVSNIVHINLDINSRPLLFSFFKNLIGIVALWQLYDLLPIKYKQYHPKIYKYSFFIFAFHGIPINFIKALLKLKLPNTYLFNFGIYLFSFIIVVFVSILSAKLIDKYANKIYIILTGSR